MVVAQPTVDGQRTNARASEAQGQCDDRTGIQVGVQMFGDVYY